MTELQADISTYVLDLIKDNTTYEDENGHTRSHPDNSYPPIDVLRQYFGMPKGWVELPF